MFLNIGLAKKSDATIVKVVCLFLRNSFDAMTRNLYTYDGWQGITPSFSEAGSKRIQFCNNFLTNHLVKLDDILFHIPLHCFFANIPAIV